MNSFKVDQPGRDYRALMERDARIDVATLLEAYDKEFGSAGGGEDEPKPKGKRILAVVCGVLALGLLGFGWWGFGPEGAPLTRAVAETVIDAGSGVAVEAGEAEAGEAEADEAKAGEEAKANEAKAAEEAKANEAKAAEEAKAKEAKAKPAETAPPTIVEESVDPANPIADAVSKVVKTKNGTEILEFKDKNLPPYEKPACGIVAEGCAEKGISPADSYTGNNMNDEYLAYRLNLGYRKIASLDESFITKELVISAMTDNITRLKLDIPIPSSPDYASARLYSSGYSLWPISKGYSLIYGDSHGLGIIGPDKDGKAFEGVLKSSQEVLISQIYAGRKSVTFAPLYKTVSGSVIPDNEGEWQ